MMARNPIRLVLGGMLFLGTGQASDWPMWRADPGRTGTVEATVPDKLEVLWERELPAPAPAYHDVRLQFDGGPEPIVFHGLVIVASSREDSVTAFESGTGKEAWTFLTDGPVRFAPVAAEGRIIFGSDDGCVYALSADDGSLQWKHRVVPSDRLVLGNRRFISVWPVRGGPVLKDGRVYFAAGVWPMEGIFIGCLDAASGQQIWCNDRTGYLYGTQPHQAQAMGGVAPQGYLLIDGEELMVPCSQAYPAKFDLHSGELRAFELPSAGRLPGGWFASTPGEQEAEKLKRRGLLFDSAINAKPHEDKPRAEGMPGIRETIRAGSREILFAGPWPAGVVGTVHSVAVGNQLLFVATKEGRLYALGQKPEGKAFQKWQHLLEVRKDTSPAALDYATAAGGSDLRGFGIIVGGDAGFFSSLVQKTNLNLVALVAPSEVDALRHSLLGQGIYGERISVRADQPEAQGFPPYVASLIAIAPGQPSPGPVRLTRLFESLRPFGGRLVGPAAMLDAAEAASLPRGNVMQHSTGLLVVTREGSLEGSTNYAGDWSASPDALVKAPFGVLWFDDTLGHFKRSPQPKFIDGVMISSPKDWTDASTRKGAVDYRLLPTVFSDTYTGRVLDPDEASVLRQSFSQTDLQTIQPSQYRPPTQKDDWKPEQPRPGQRINPLTGVSEPRVFPKSYGCDGGFDYGSLFTMRSGTAAFYDKTVESGTIHISGPRSGCTNSIVPANGLLNLPYFYEGCTCSYPLPMGLSLYSLPANHEQWATWGEVNTVDLAGKIKRIGINLGAPGDRMTNGGTLWLDTPSVGGPSPAVEVEMHPPEASPYYRHAVWIRGGQGWPWVAASGIAGLERLVIHGIKPGSYLVRLVFAEPEDGAKVGSRSFDVSVQGTAVAKGLDLVDRTGSAMQVLTESFPGIKVAEDGLLAIGLKAQHGQTVLSGVEILSSEISPEALPDPATVPGRLP